MARSRLSNLPGLKIQTRATPNGNVTGTANGNSYVCDSENHMIQMVKGATTITMKYDAFGNRVSKTVNGVTTQYLVDDLNPTGYSQVLDELTGPIGSGVVQRTYTYGLQRISQDQYISNAWLLSYYQYDGGGSVRQLTNSTGQVTDSYEYDAFGNSFTKQGTTPNNYLYRGEQYDSDLGLYYLRARYYNPTTGRFMSRDPLSGQAKDPASLHKYLYANGDPVNGIDPSGRGAMIETVFTNTDVSSPLEAGAAKAVAFAEEKCLFGVALSILEVNLFVENENWKTGTTATASLIYLGACLLKFIPGPPAPPPTPPPPAPPPPPPCFDLNCWNPPPGTPIN
jgi:RHS repeat-associated protein